MTKIESDPVIKEIPVFLSQELNGALYLFQYPVKSAYTNRSFSVLKSAIKPQNKQIKLVLAVDTNSVNYDTSKGEQISCLVDGGRIGKDKSEEREFPSGLMDKMTLQSTCSVPDAERYALALWRNQEIHLNPIQAFIELRNYLSYLDKSDKRVKETSKSGDIEMESADEPTQITVKFAQQESEKLKRARERSFNYISKKCAEEPWFTTEFHYSHTEKSEVLRRLLICPVPWEEPSQLSLTSQQYCQLLCPMELTGENTFGLEAKTLQKLQSVPLVESVRHLMQRGMVLSFDELCGLLGGDVDPAEVVRALQIVAVLVQGNWVLKSEELYNKDATYHYGLTAEELCKGRDYIIGLFTVSPWVQLKSFQKEVKLPFEDIREILEQIAVLYPRQGWQFSLPYDNSFEARFPGVAARQQAMWKARMKNL